MMYSVGVSTFEYLITEILHADSTIATDPSLGNIGFMVGYRFVENISSRHKLGRDPLDLIKFVCKGMHFPERRFDCHPITIPIRS